MSRERRSIGDSFDHVLDGVVAGCRRDTHDLSLIKVTANVVREEILWGPSGALATSLAGGVLPYEDVIDTWDARRER